MGYRSSKEVNWLDGVKPRVQGLYYSGEWIENLAGLSVAVIGSRRMTEYGRRVVEKLVPKLVDEGKVIVSGFMYGIDQAAHRVCIECGGRTVAVLGWGIEDRMEKEDEVLAQEITNKGGMIVSEWKNQKGALWTFPQRNRIVAAMSNDIYVVEAAVRSGALITADLGIKMKKQVWAVPGPVTSRVSEGTNSLIAQGKARIWLPDNGSIQNLNKDLGDMNIYSLLQNETLTIDDLVKKTGLPINQVMSDMTMMVLRGEVEEREGKYYFSDSKFSRESK